VAVSYLTGNSSRPTAQKMNELWSEADTIVDKVMDGKTTYLAHPVAIISPPESVIKGKEFYFYTSGNHDATDASVLYSLNTSLPASYNQSTYDAAASGATFNYYDSTLKYATSTAGLGLDFSLKAHTTTTGGVTYYIWDKGQPNVEKKWRFAVAEILIGDAIDNGDGTYKFEFSNSYDKYNCFKLHNCTGNDITFYFGTATSNNYSLTIPKYSQRCVRRDSVTSGYDSTYKYFFKCFRDDPRYLHFKSQTGFVPASMQANNITNASFLYNILEALGQRKDSRTLYGSIPPPCRITFDPQTYTDIGSEYQTAGYFPSISNSTLIADLVFHKGNLSYFRATNASSTPETGSITFDGFAGFVSAMSGAGLTATTTGTSATINKSSSKDIFYLWQQSTNLLVWNNSPRVLNLGASGGANAVLETKMGEPERPDNDPHQSDGVLGISEIAFLNGTSTTVGDYITEYQSNMSGYCSTFGENVKLTTEGPILFSTEHWPIATDLTVTDPEGVYKGFIRSPYFTLALDGSNDAQVSVVTDRAIAHKFNSRSGWPNYDYKHHRMFEGPKHPKQYEDRGSAYTHLDITNDPVGESGADFGQNNIGTLTESNVQFQTCAVNTKIEPFNINLTDNRNYPLTLPGDVSHELELKKAAGSSITQFQNAIGGDDTLYIRMNLLKEHYNDMVTMLKRCKKIRPLCFDEVYFGDLAPVPRDIRIFNNYTAYLAPKNCYASFTDGSAEHLLYQRLGIDIKKRQDFPDDIYTNATAGDQAVMDDYRWVTVADVKAKAATMGFKFRFEKQYALLDFERKEVFWLDTISLGYCDIFETAEAGNWRIPIATPVLSGSTYISGLSDSTTYINSLGIATDSTNLLTKLISKSTASNYSVYLYTIDTSRSGYPSTSTRAKLARKRLDSSTDDVIVNLNGDENTITPPAGQWIYCICLTQPVLHTG